ncbi:MAG TPA: hypothetical protein VGL42_13470 [Opitutaceae bacterium]|jgi:hypothetical protein
MKSTSISRFPSPRPARARAVTGIRSVSQAAPALAGSTYNSIADPSEDFFSQMWRPGLLDELQAPLTRYHE